MTASVSWQKGWHDRSSQIICCDSSERVHAKLNHFFRAPAVRRNKSCNPMPIQGMTLTRNSAQLYASFEDLHGICYASEGWRGDRVSEEGGRAVKEMSHNVHAAKANAAAGVDFEHEQQCCTGPQPPHEHFAYTQSTGCRTVSRVRLQG